jgi:hypothetical protein
MNYQINQQFVNKLVALTQKILVDQATILGGQTASPQAHLIFSDEDLNEQNNQNALRNKYFPLQRQGVVPFAGDNEEEHSNRMFYFNELRTEIKELTDNYQNFGLILPSSTVLSASQQSQENKIYTFRGDQLLSIYKIVFKLCHGYEQRKINELENKQQHQEPILPSAATIIAEKAKDPLQDLGEKILVKGPSGAFDIILTKQELEDMLQSAQRAQEIAQLKGIPLDHYGKPLLTLFMTNDQLNNPLFVEIKKRSLFTQYAAISLSDAQLAHGQEITVSVKESLHILQSRAALKAQFDLIKAAGGKIKIIQDVQLDMNGNAFLIAKDQKGDEFRVEIDLKIPAGAEKRYKFIVSAPNESGIITDFILVLNQKELPELKTNSISELFEKNDQQVMEGPRSAENPAKNLKIVKFKPKSKKQKPGKEKIQEEGTQGFSFHVPDLSSATLPDTLPIEFEEKERSARISPLPMPSVQAKQKGKQRIRTARIIVGKKIMRKKLIPSTRQSYQPKENQQKPSSPVKNLFFPQAAKPQQTSFAVQTKENKQPTQFVQTQTNQNNPLQNPAVVAAAAAGGGLLAGSAIVTSISVFLA